jgi:hypothetical protein
MSAAMCPCLPRLDNLRRITILILTECPLKIRFQELFVICNQKEWSVFKVMRDVGGRKLTFRRNFGNVEE